MAFDSPGQQFFYLVTCPSVLVLFTARILGPKYTPTASAIVAVANLIGIYTIIYLPKKSFEEFPVVS